MLALRIVLAATLFWTAAPAAAQWLNYPTAGIPRTADGKANLSAPAPRSDDGKPDLSGLWRPAAILIGDAGSCAKTVPGTKQHIIATAATTARTLTLRVMTRSISFVALAFTTCVPRFRARACVAESDKMPSSGNGVPAYGRAGSI